MSKKIAILTLPLIYNYGAILQAYALQKSVKNLGYDCWLIDKELPIYPYYRRPLSIISRIIGRFLRGKKGYEIFPYWMSKKTENIISQNTRKFVEKNILPKTEQILNLSSNNDIYDVYLVGSDQVWRKSITLKMYDYLFGFVRSNKKKCSYAASFGVDKWEFNKKETENLKPLFKSLDIVTVREDSAVSLLRNNIGIEATQVLDPTLLLSREDYCRLIENMPLKNEEPFIFSYILDNDEDKKQISEHLALNKNMPIYSLMPKSTPNYNVDVCDCIYPAVEEWIRGFRDCDFVVTDSFHGTVFSIIFEKPFVVLRYARRGNTRLDSLLRLFNLENRILSSAADVENCIYKQINWSNVHTILNEKKRSSIEKLSDMIK